MSSQLNQRELWIVLNINLVISVFGSLQNVFLLNTQSKRLQSMNRYNEAGKLYVACNEITKAVNCFIICKHANDIKPLKLTSPNNQYSKAYQIVSCRKYLIYGWILFLSCIAILVRISSIKICINNVKIILYFQYDFLIFAILFIWIISFAFSVELIAMTIITKYTFALNPIHNCDGTLNITIDMSIGNYITNTISPSFSYSNYDYYKKFNKNNSEIMYYY